MGRKINAIPTDTLELDVNEKSNGELVKENSPVVNKIEEEVEVEPVKSAENIHTISIKRAQKQEEADIQRAKKNPGFKMFIPPKRNIEERHTHSIYIKDAVFYKLRRIARNKNYSIGEVLEFLVRGIEDNN